MAATVHFKTKRLDVSPWAQSLSGMVRQKLIDELGVVLTPEVLQHLPEPLQISNSAEAIDRWIDDRVAESDVLTIRDLSSDELIGLLILASFEEPGELPMVHLGYLLGVSHWGKGFATELLLGLVQWYEDEGQAVQLLGGVEQDNVASAKVLQKAGFGKVDALSKGSTDMFVRVFEAR